MPLDTDTAPMQEVRQFVLRLAALQDKWYSEPSLPNLSPRMVNGLLDYNKAVLRGYPLLRLILAAICGTLLWLSAAIPGFGFQLSLVVLLTLYYVHRTQASPEYRCAAYALTQTDDVRVLPVLIQATRHQGGQHWRIEAAIFHLLEQVTGEHVGLLNEADQQRLWTVAMEWSPLVVKYGDELALRTLRVLSLIGNQASLSRMQELTRRNESRELSSIEHPVIAAARTLVPLMEARLRRQQIPATLLRAADTPTSQPETLLRAAHATSRERPQQLLRASQSEQEETQA